MGCGIVGISMAVVIILLAIGFLFAGGFDKGMLEALFICGAVENYALSVRYLSMRRKKGWAFLLGALVLTGAVVLIII